MESGVDCVVRTYVLQVVETANGKMKLRPIKGWWWFSMSLIIKKTKERKGYRERKAVVMEEKRMESENEGGCNRKAVSQDERRMLGV